MEQLTAEFWDEKRSWEATVDQALEEQKQQQKLLPQQQPSQPQHAADTAAAAAAVVVEVQQPTQSTTEENGSASEPEPQSEATASTTEPALAATTTTTTTTESKTKKKSKKKTQQPAEAPTTSAASVDKRRNQKSAANTTVVRVLGPLASSNRAAWVSRPIVTPAKPATNGVGDLPFGDSREFPKLGEVPPPLPKSAKRQQSQSDDRPSEAQAESTATSTAGAAADDTEWHVVDHAEAQQAESEHRNSVESSEQTAPPAAAPQPETAEATSTAEQLPGNKRPLSEEQTLQFEAVLTEPPEKRSKVQQVLSPSPSAFNPTEPSQRYLQSTDNDESEEARLAGAEALREEAKGEADRL